MATHSSILAWRIPWTEELVATIHEVTTEQLSDTHRHKGLQWAPWKPDS